MKPVEELLVGKRGLQRNERGTDRFDGMPHGVGQGVAVARGTGGGVGGAARAHDDGRSFGPADEAFLRAVVHPAYPIAQQQQFADGGMADEFHARLPAPLHKCVGNIPRLAAFGKYAAALLGGETNAALFKKTRQGPVVELRVGGDEKLPVGLYLGEEFVGRLDVRQVATPFARDAYFPGGFLHLFQQGHLRYGRSCRLDCCHHPGRSAAHHDEVVFHSSLL